MSDKVQKSWEDFLNPDILRPNLIIASLYVTAFEMLKGIIVDRIKGFFTLGFGPTGASVDPAYQTDVLAKNRSPLYASLEWFKEQGAIDDQDLAKYERVKECRNELAHEIPRLLMNGFRNDFPKRFTEIIELVDKIERWWVVNVEIPINPDFDDKEVDIAGIVPGTTMALRLLLEIALGSEEESRKYLDEFIKRTRPKNPS
jgi:hypothetical protein